MNTGIGMYVSNLLSPLFYGSILGVIVGGVLLFTNARQFDRYTRTVVISLTVLAFITTLSLTALAIAFGNSHPSALPLPLP